MKLKNTAIESDRCIHIAQKSKIVHVIKETTRRKSRAQSLAVVYFRTVPRNETI